MARRAAFLLLLSLAAPARAAEVLTGIDVILENGMRELRGKRVGLITNHTGKDRLGRSSVSILSTAEGVELKAVFSPEHGFAGTLEDAFVASDTLKLPNGKSIPIYSLYGSTLAPTSSMLSGLDVLVYDIQDVGARFYTYATTMGMAMEAAARHRKEFIVLDRPNPITGDFVEGPVLSTGIRHFTAYFSVPVRHGMTVGEIARLHNVMGKVGVRLQVVPLKGWTRDMWYDQTGLPWIKPSPNMPDLDAAALYPGIGCFESTNISVGRGTPIPFRWVGAPWLDAKALVARLKKAGIAGVEFETAVFTPDKPPYQGKRSRGVRLRVTDRDMARPLEVFAHLVCALRDLHPLEFGIRWEEERRMVGDDRFRELYENGAGPDEIVRYFNESARRFAAGRSAFLLY